jgi:NTE family protein
MGYRLGLVLSGGGVRGVAHAGVLKAMTEHGIRPDCIAGSSSGALVGALYGAGYSPEEMLQFFVDKNPFRLSRLAVAGPGWIDTAKVAADFMEYFPEDSFESLDGRLFVTATDIVQGKLTIFDSGPLISAVLASCSVPLVFTPTTIDGRSYSDGGIVNNFPVEPLEGLCGTIIGVYASPIRDAHQTSLSSSVAVWQRALEVGSYFASKPKFDRCALVICPEALSRYGLFDTKHVEAIFEVGYAAALERMESIKRVAERED